MAAGCFAVVLSCSCQKGSVQITREKKVFTLRSKAASFCRRRMMLLKVLILMHTWQFCCACPESCLNRTGLNPDVNFEMCCNTQMLVEDVHKIL